MSDKTSIEWTDATFNPWWGCTKVSPGCDHCYAERDAARFSPKVPLWGVGSSRREFGEDHWLKPVTWNARATKAGKRMRVFCASMADVFDNDAPQGAREMLWDLIEKTHMLDWQLLTKRIGNVARMVPVRWTNEFFPDNVWIGISVVNQDEADRDIPKLLALPAYIHWLSCEPLLGPLDLRSYLVGHEENGIAAGRPVGTCIGWTPPLDWVVVGGESGPKARPMHPDWARTIRDQCGVADVPFLFKQWGEWASVSEVDGPGAHFHFPDGATVRRLGKRGAGRTLDRVEHNNYPVLL
jgi:protein gp37